MISFNGQAIRIDDWLHSAPNHWKRRPLKYLMTRTSIRGKADAQLLSVYRDFGVVRREGREDNHNRVGMDLSNYLYVKPGDLVINKMKAWQGSLGISRFSGIVSPAYFVYDVDDGMFSPYLHYVLRSEPYFREYARISDGVRTNQWDLDADEFGRMLLLIPPYEKQKEIADFLDRKTAAIDELITRKQQLIERLEELRASLINRAVTKGLNPDVEMKDSGVEWIGEIPKHWEVKRLKYISPKQTVGVVVNPSSYVEDNGEVPFIYGSEVSAGVIDVSKARRITHRSNRKLIKSQLKTGDLVSVRVGDPGVTAVVPPELNGINCGSIMIIRSSDRFNSDWLCFLMNSKTGRHNVWLVAYGAAQKQYNISHAIDFLYPVPPIEEQEYIACFLNEESDKIGGIVVSFQEVVSRLQEYRQSLITAAVTGQLDVSAPSTHHSTDRQLALLATE